MKINSGTSAQAPAPHPYSFSYILIYSQVGIIGGSGLDDPEILDGRKETYLETPYGTWKPLEVRYRVWFRLQYAIWVLCDIFFIHFSFMTWKCRCDFWCPDQWQNQWHRMCAFGTSRPKALDNAVKHKLSCQCVGFKERRMHPYNRDHCDWFAARAHQTGWHCDSGQFHRSYHETQSDILRWQRIVAIWSLPSSNGTFILRKDPRCDYPNSLRSRFVRIHHSVGL